MSWTEAEVNLIELMKLFPILYTYKESEGDRTFCRLKSKAWESLADLAKLGLKELHTQWSNILNTYIKMYLSIQKGDVKKIERFKSDNRTGKYFDGSLSFLDQHIRHIKIDGDIFGYMQKIFYEIHNVGTYDMDLLDPVKVSQEVLRKVINERSDADFLDDEYVECILDVVKVCIDQALNELTPSQIEGSDNTDDIETDDNSTKDTNNSLNVHEKDMKTFCSDLADYVTSRFSLMQQDKIRKSIASLVTDLEMQK